MAWSATSKVIVMTLRLHISILFTYSIPFLIFVAKKGSDK